MKHLITTEILILTFWHIAVTLVDIIQKKILVNANVILFIFFLLEPNISH